MGPKKKLTREEILLRKRLRERERYEKIKKDPKLLEEQKVKEKLKYEQKKKKKQIKLVKDMSTRELRAKRKQWKVNSNAYYKRKTNLNGNLLQNTPPDTPPDSPVGGNVAVEQRLSSARKRVSRDRSKVIQRNKKLIQKNEALKKQADKWKKRFYRLQEKNLKDNPKVMTPRTSANKILKCRDKNIIRKKLVFGEALKAQIKRNLNCIKCPRKKYSYVSSLIGDRKLFKKCKIFKDVIELFESKTLKYKNRTVIDRKRNKKLDKIKLSVKKFLEDDSNSKLTPGKKDTVTRKKKKMQKRYLSDTMKNLHKKFIAEKNVNISYALFCRLRPFYVVYQKPDARDTCLCKLCANFGYLVIGLYKSKIIKQKSATECIESITCDQFNVNCLQRKCTVCLNKQIIYNEFDAHKVVQFDKWDTKKEYFKDKRGKNKIANITFKTSICKNVLNVVGTFEEDMLKYMTHKGNISNQFITIKYLKNNMTENEVLVHMDFSENYQLKYAEEIQSLHFGGSRKQVSLHTVSLYYRYNNYEDLKVKSFCSLSANLNHGPVAILTHLTPIFMFIKKIKPHLKTIHFLSDGPSSQYRNKLLFYLFVSKMKDFFHDINSATWNYQEAGHGKGAPDGIGGSVKRTADRLIAEGKDISSVEILNNELKSNLRNIEIYLITDEEFKKVSENLNTQNAIPFKGTLKVHQIIVNYSKAPDKLVLKSLSCFKCLEKCHHFTLGVIRYPRQKKETEDQEKKKEEQIDPMSCVTATLGSEGESSSSTAQKVSTKNKVVKHKIKNKLPIKTLSQKIKEIKGEMKSKNNNIFDVDEIMGCLSKK